MPPSFEFTTHRLTVNLEYLSYDLPSPILHHFITPIILAQAGQPVLSRDLSVALAPGSSGFSTLSQSTPSSRAVKAQAGSASLFLRVLRTLEEVVLAVRSLGCNAVEHHIQEGPFQLRSIRPHLVGLHRRIRAQLDTFGLGLGRRGFEYIGDHQPQRHCCPQGLAAARKIQGPFISRVLRFTSPILFSSLPLSTFCSASACLPHSLPSFLLCTLLPSSPSPGLPNERLCLPLSSPWLH